MSIPVKTAIYGLHSPRHSRENGNPWAVTLKLDSRLRGNDRVASSSVIPVKTGIEATAREHEVAGGYGQQ